MPRYICISVTCPSARIGATVRNRGLCAGCGGRLVEIDERLAFRWWRFVGLVIATTLIIAAAGWPLYSGRIRSIRTEFAKRDELRRLVASREAERQLRTVIEADLLQGVRLADSVLGKEVRLRAIQRALADAPVQSADTLALYRDSISKLDQAIVADLQGYRHALAAAREHTAAGHRLIGNSAGSGPVADDATQVLNELEAASDTMPSSARQTVFRIVRLHLQSLSDIAEPQLRQAFSAASRTLYESTKPVAAQAR